MDLFRYLPNAKFILAEEIGPQVGVKEYPGSKARYAYDGPTDLIKQMYRGGRMTTRECSIVMAEARSLHLFLKQGPVIARPSAELSQDLVDTEVRLRLADFKMPFEVVAVELPQPFAGPLAPYLIFLWDVAPGRLCAWTYIPKTNFTLDVTVDDDGRTIEDWLNDGASFGTPDEEEKRILRVGMRIAINSVLLMMHRGFDLSPLPPKVIKNRAGRDERLRRLVNREPQSVIFRDLKPTNRPPVQYVGEVDPTGIHYRPHRRRGHWKQQAHGPKHAERKTIWVEPYWTGPADPEEKTPPTIIYRD